ncbi:SIMPL domain-containing protein [Pseudoalteromonas sp. CnMc7-15]|uniref:SIMPL domain-containing protein n=1 Tax=unclassified Pseudoalteromonas TaxID=194690 RepID=UPI001EF6E750|nr:SIMPL domain-containing protein [Pseudoalteromonas sp. CnMc7-15]MCG7566272.1 SIMPL domain-containing protein [Pseudoalteromonas sp. CnMc7-15]
MHKSITHINILPAFLLALGLASIGFLLHSAIVQFKAMDRTVTVKGLAEQQVPADTAIWPIAFTEAGDKLDDVMAAVEKKQAAVVAFLKLHGFSDEEISLGQIAVVDKKAQQYGPEQVGLRYLVTANMSVYSQDPEKVRHASSQISELAKQGIAVSGDSYSNRIEYLFTSLNDLKPQMIEQATHNAREVATKFAHDSQSTLGKIKSARQGQFSISSRDSNSPHLKKVRVVSTIEYYLVD